jgi:hypothetical protein
MGLTFMCALRDPHNASPDRLDPPNRNGCAQVRRSRIMFHS